MRIDPSTTSSDPQPTHSSVRNVRSLRFKIPPPEQETPKPGLTPQPEPNSAAYRMAQQKKAEEERARIRATRRYIDRSSIEH